NRENDSFQVKNCYYCTVRNQAQTFQQSYSYKSAAYHDATNQLQEHYDSITAYHNTEKFSYNQAVDQDHEMKSQESDYNIEKFKQIKIDENFFISHANIIEIICQNCKQFFSAQIEEETIFQRFYYTTCKISLKFSSLLKLICLNSECIMIISNHN